MSYVYKFFNKEEEVIYVGRTSQSMRQRMGQHFSDYGHLSKICYEDTARIEYMVLGSKVASEIVELYLINTLKPKFNTQKKEDSPLGIEMDELKWEWRSYEGFQDRDAYELEEMRDRWHKSRYENLELTEENRQLKENAKNSLKEIRILNNKVNTLSKKITEVHRDGFLSVQSSLPSGDLIKLRLWDTEKIEAIYALDNMHNVYFEADIIINQNPCAKLLIYYEEGVVFYKDNNSVFTNEFLNGFDAIRFNLVEDIGFKTNASASQLDIIRSILSEEEAFQISS